MHNRSMNCIANTYSADYDGRHDYKIPGLHMTYDPLELVLYTPHKKEYICHIASLEVVRGLNKSFEIDHSGFSLYANGTLTVRN